jgi:hypothetical protein
MSAYGRANETHDLFSGQELVNFLGDSQHCIK